MDQWQWRRDQKCCHLVTAAASFCVQTVRTQHLAITQNEVIRFWVPNDDSMPRIRSFVFSTNNIWRSTCAKMSDNCGNTPDVVRCSISFCNAKILNKRQKYKIDKNVPRPHFVWFYWRLPPHFPTVDPLACTQTVDTVRVWCPNWGCAFAFPRGPHSECSATIASTRNENCRLDAENETLIDFSLFH